MTAANDLKLTNSKSLLGAFLEVLKPQPTIKIEVFSKESKLLCTFEWEASNSYKIVLPKFENTLEQQNTITSLKMTGLIDLMFDFSRWDKPITARNSSRLIGMDTWLEKNTAERFLVPDTNIILNHTISSITSVLGDDFLKKIKIVIPRLVIIEMENKANSIKTNEKDTSKLVQKRKIFLGYSEILFLKEHGAMLFTDLPSELLAQFPTISSEHNADAWIRREVKEYEKLALSRKGKCIFITSDLVSSLSSLAEGIDTIYVSEFLEHVLLSATLPLVIKSITKLSVLLETVHVRIGKTQYEINGFWSGKTTNDLINEWLRISSTVV